ncbi:MAG: PEP-CTERM sorting domain-containing protein, partial [Gammaproteobacteria bacterium]|nr:PEP-CTERM sorting domain-containing protein [Gammaproteobacteria bacterium]
MTKSILAAAILTLTTASAQALVVDSTTTDGAALVDQITGSGITVDAGSINYQGSANQSGFFSDGIASGIGIESGILLTTGSAFDAQGPNTSDSKTVNVSSPGDSDLTALSGFNTNDAAVLEFDFVSDGGDLFFNFVFASEEYNEYVNSSFNDVFAFFVDGVNVAIAPDGQEVAINTVNCGNPFSSVGPNCDSYNNNDVSDG